MKRLQNSLDLIGPSTENYLDATNIINKLCLKKALVWKQMHKSQNDVLLALSAASHNAILIARNKSDFEKIRHYCPVDLIYY